ncbi:MAG: DUF1697 domain-containing protein [Rhodocyclaceae bacterium]|nr:DUF1697 domain-containing protein [Rhodocyclaceae bacterium]
MSRHVALLRGINVGGRNRLSMAALVDVFESLGYPVVDTLIQSGNVVFRAPPGEGDAAAGRVSREILGRHGFEPAVLVLAAPAFAAVVADNPFPADAGKALHVFFVSEPPSAADLPRLNRLASPTEQFVLGPKAFYLLAPDGIGRSRLAPAVESALGVPVTARNGNTVMALAGLLADG